MRNVYVPPTVSMDTSVEKAAKLIRTGQEDVVVVHDHAYHDQCTQNPEICKILKETKLTAE